MCELSYITECWKHIPKSYFNAAEPEFTFYYCTLNMTGRYYYTYL